MTISIYNGSAELYDAISQMNGVQIVPMNEGGKNIIDPVVTPYQVANEDTIEIMFGTDRFKKYLENTSISTSYKIVIMEDSDKVKRYLTLLSDLHLPCMAVINNDKANEYIINLLTNLFNN